MVTFLSKFHRVVSAYCTSSVYPIRQYGFKCSMHSLVEITSRKSIKPSSPTPHHNRYLKLSLLDQLLPPTVYGTILYFYTPTTNHCDHDVAPSKVSETTSKRLQASLSETLVHCYPLAGRLKGTASIECNDEGAHFVEARVRCQLSDFLKQPNPELLKKFMAEHDSKTAQIALGTCVLLVQISVFNCGGIVVAVSPSHKIADGISLHTFVRLWAAINRGEYHQLVLPEFNGATLLPAKDLSTMHNFLGRPIPTQTLNTRRFVFDVSKMTSLKAEIGSRIQKFTPTNGQLVLAIILKCALAASHQSKPDGDTTSRLTVLSQMVNLRRRMVPEVPENEMGNWFWALSLLFKENETEIHELVINMNKGLTNFCKEKANRFKGDDGFLVVSESMREKADLYKAEKGINLYRSTSVCKFPLYEIDFGWGKPTWVSSPSEHKNFILLLDTKSGDGIEAWVTLDQQEMAIFECDEELLAFSSVNPSIVN
ncbi:acyltransferase Pun1-like [Rosa sericea]